MRSRLLAAIMLFSCALASAQVSSPGWPAIHGPFSWADNVMNSTTIARSPGGIYDLRQKTIGIFTPAFEIVSYDAPSQVALNPEFFSYALGAGLYEDASALLFARGLYQNSDTLSYLRGVLCYDIHDFSRAAECFALVPSSSPWYWQARSYLDVWEAEPAITYKAKSPVLAALMSAVIPGSGKMYAGDLRSGISTLLIVGALGAMTAESAHKLGWEDWRTIVLGSVFGVFYIGNIYGSAVSVSVMKNSYQDAQKATLLFNLHIPLHQF